MDYKIISDGCCDLEKEIIEQYNLRIFIYHLMRRHIIKRLKKSEFVKYMSEW
mgnify:CR=1 FL=1